MAEKLLEVRDLTVRFGTTTILENVALDLEQGEFLAIVGVSGSGKTTLFNCLAGLLRPNRGQILLGGKDISGESGHVSYMLQKDLLLKHFTILDNVCLPLRLQGLRPAEARRRAEPYLPAFGLAEAAGQYPREISGGMAQRAAFLRTCLHGKDLLLLDEPFSALDAITKSQIHDWYLDRMMELKRSAIFITHDIDEALKLSHRILVLAGRPAEVRLDLPLCPIGERPGKWMDAEERLALKQLILEQLDS